MRKRLRSMINTAIQHGNLHIHLLKSSFAAWAAGCLFFLVSVGGAYAAQWADYVEASERIIAGGVIAFIFFMCICLICLVLGVWVES